MKPVEAGRVFVFPEVTFDIQQHFDAVAKIVEEFQGHHGFDFIIHVLREKNQILIFSTGETIPKINVYDRPCMVTFQTLSIDGEKEGKSLEIPYSASRLREVIQGLGQIDSIPAGIDIGKIELHMACHDDAVLSMNDDFFDMDDF